MDHQPSITPWDLECMLYDETAEPTALPLSLLAEITYGFSNEQEIGRGGFAVVYKGKLENRNVAVKKMSNVYMDENVFHQEVECLMMVKHKNVVKFLGYCADRQGSVEWYKGKFVMADVNKWLLCFEYLPKGGLDNYINDKSRKLPWRDCYQIITGICQGLHYLHQNNILHLDLKPANILLDRNWVPKITDFGLSRRFEDMQSRVITTKIVGTLGYLAPEFGNKEITYQFDIYSLGVIIMEILTGERGHHDVDNVVASWSKSLEKSQREVQQEQVRVCAEIGIECTNFNPVKRPDTRNIIDRLDKTKPMDGYIEIGVITSQKGEDITDAVRKANLQRDDPLNLAEKIVRNLENAAEDLYAKRSDVHREITYVERQHGTPTLEVERWLEKVDNIICEVKVILTEWREKDVTLLASEKFCEVLECFSTCPNTIQERAGPSMSSERRNLQDALQYIEDDPTVGMIGIWGPGGVGKTHLLRNINNSFDVGGGTPFDLVLFITASRGGSVEKVQSQIIQRLYLGSTGSKVHTIHEYMKAKSFLVLLDDLWEQINLEDVGIPYPLGYISNLKRKVVLTTRLRNVCDQMQVTKKLKVTCLPEHEAWQLFKENVGDITLSSPNIDALARELMKELKGLPLALAAVGKAMYLKDMAQWEYAIQYVQQSCCTEDEGQVELGMEAVVFRSMKFSYDNLRNDTLRCCFLTCALWPEDEKILKVDLAQCWMGLGLVNEQDIESSFRKSYSLIADLTNACLLEEWGDGYGFIKVHDLIRDMALWISCDCGENNAKWIVPSRVRDNIPWDRVAKIVECISLAKPAEGPWLLPKRVAQLFPIGFCPMKLRILCLRNNKLDESIIAGAIKNCISLTYLDLRGNTLERIPEELCSLGKLEYLDLSENQIRVKAVPHRFGNLINLKFLYLNSSGIRTIPIDVISSLKALQVIDLRSFSSDVVAHGAVFQELGNLPQLKAVGTEAEGFAQFESLREVANLPIRYLSLRALNNNQGAFCLSNILSNNFAQRTLCDLDIRFCVTLERIIVRSDTRQPNDHFGALSKLCIATMPLLKVITWMGAASPASIFPRLANLDLSNCFSLLHLSWVMYLPLLEQLHISDCFSMVQAFMRCHGDRLRNGQDTTKTFPRLKFLSLLLNRSLCTIADIGMEFPSLERLELKGCQKLKRLPFQLDSLPLNLKELWLDDVNCWERLECEEGVKTFLQPTLKFGREYE